ncbi:MAG: apolipoprotein N-acyltransferase [Acidobacteria bacterium]|nr:apolipoprotein N-acyltransferase [Acidobacteriota bacterium]
MKQYLLLAVSAAMITLAFLPVTAALPMFFFFVPAIFVAMEVKSRKRRFWMGVLWGALIFLMNFYWTVIPIHYYGKMSYPLSVLLFFPLMVYEMLPFTLWFFFFPFLYRRNLLLPALVFPFLTGLLPLIFPYSLSSALSGMPVLVQTASWWGEWGLDFLIVLVNVLLFTGWRQKSRRHIVFAVGVVLLMAAQGAFVILPRSGREVAKNCPELSVVVIQPCIRDGDSEQLKEHKFFSAIHEISGTAAGKLVIFPESALPDGIVSRPDFMDVMREIRRRLDADSLLFNGVVFRNGLLTNSEFLIGKDGTVSRYDKQHLMWFGERFPFYSLFRRLPIYAAQFANFSPGPEKGVLKDGAIGIATPICLECIYPGYVAGLVKGANLIVNPVDDEWFGTTRATRLHFAQVRLKAVENCCYLIRATNTGYTVVLNQRGQVVKALPEGTPGYLVLNVPLFSGATLFQEIYGWIPFFGILVFCGLLVWNRRGKEE